MIIVLEIRVNCYDDNKMKILFLSLKLPIFRNDPPIPQMFIVHSWLRKIYVLLSDLVLLQERSK